MACSPECRDCADERPRCDCCDSHDEHNEREEEAHAYWAGYFGVGPDVPVDVRLARLKAFGEFYGWLERET